MSNEIPISPPPKVFISYSWEVDSHLDLVLNLCQKLRSNGIDCKIDQFEQRPKEGWRDWMMNQIDSAEYVLIACSEPYYRAYRKLQDTESLTGKGIAWEAQYIAQKIYDSKGQATKFIPILFSREDKEYIPPQLLDASRYELYLKDEKGYNVLWRHLASRPDIVPVPLGELTLSHQNRTEDFINERLRRIALVKQLVDTSAGCHDSCRRGDVIFVHGVVGDAFSTWLPDEKSPDDCWLRWLGEEMPGVGVWSVSYEIQPNTWQDSPAPLAQRANRLLRELANQKFGQCPLIFIAYDLGGLLVKEMLKFAWKEMNQSRKKIGEQTQGIMFLSTPGSIDSNRIDNWMEFLDQSLKAQQVDLSFRLLGQLSQHFSELNKEYWELSINRQIKSFIFYENQPYGNNIIIDLKASNPELPGTASDLIELLEIDYVDHCSICQPQSRQDEVYREVKQFIQKQLLTRLIDSEGSFIIKNDAGDKLDLKKKPSSYGYNASDPSYDITNPEIVRAWKELHHRVELLYTKFLQFRDEIIRWGEAIRYDDNEEIKEYTHEKVREYINKQARKYTYEARRRMKETVQDEANQFVAAVQSGSLEPISEAEYVKVLSNFPDYCDAVEQTIGLDFEKAYEITEVLTKWLYKALHTADQTLRQALSAGKL
jgi:hypothetical protein